MGCHIYLYEVVHSEININEWVEEYRKDYDKILQYLEKTSKKYNETFGMNTIPIPDVLKQPWLFYRDLTILTKDHDYNLWYESWFELFNYYKQEYDSYKLMSVKNALCDYSVYESKYLKIPCQYLEENEFGHILYESFIELKELDCPWIRGGEYDLGFSNKELFLKYFREEFFKHSSWTDGDPSKWTEFNDAYEFFDKTFIDGEHFIELG